MTVAAAVAMRGMTTTVPSAGAVGVVSVVDVLTVVMVAIVVGRGCGSWVVGKGQLAVGSR